MNVADDDLDDDDDDEIKLYSSLVSTRTPSPLSCLSRKLCTINRYNWFLGWVYHGLKFTTSQQERVGMLFVIIDMFRKKKRIYILLLHRVYV